MILLVALCLAVDVLFLTVRYDGKSDAYFDGYDHAERDARRRQEEREEEEAAERRMDERRARERYEDQLYEERFDYKIQQEEHGADQ